MDQQEIIWTLFILAISSLATLVWWQMRKIDEKAGKVELDECAKKVEARLSKIEIDFDGVVADLRVRIDTGHERIYDKMEENARETRGILNNLNQYLLTQAGGRKND